MKVIALPEQKIDDALQEMGALRGEVPRKRPELGKSALQSFAVTVWRTQANDTELYKKLVLKPLVVEYVPLARALEYLTEAVKEV